MPFRDRVARRFGETVSAPVSDQISLRCAVPLDQFPCSLSPPPGPDKVYNGNDSLCANLANQNTTISDPRIGTDSGCSKPSDRNKASARHSCKSTGAGRGKRGDTEYMVRESLVPRHRGAQRILKHRKEKLGTKRRGVKTRSNTTGSAVEVRHSVRRTTRSACSPVVAQSPKASLTRLDASDASADDELVGLLGRGRFTGGRVTRASSRQIMTDRHGKQLSPTSPYLSCEYPYPLCTKCDDMVLMLPSAVHDVCRTQSSSTYLGSPPPDGPPRSLTCSSYL